MSAQLSRSVAVYSRHFVASRINAPAVVVAVVFTLDHIVTTQTTMGWTLDSTGGCSQVVRLFSTVQGQIPHDGS